MKRRPKVDCPICGKAVALLGKDLRFARHKDYLTREYCESSGATEVFMVHVRRLRREQWPLIVRRIEEIERSMSRLESSWATHRHHVVRQLESVVALLQSRLAEKVAKLRDKKG